jgi:tetratricopeptide (TPR) repeat protein
MKKIIKLVSIIFILTIVPRFVLANQDSLFQLGNSLYTQMKYDSSITEYQKLVQHESINSILYYNLANAYFKSKQFDSSLKYYRLSLKLNSRNKNCLQNLNLCKSKLNIQNGNGDRILLKVGLILNFISINTFSWIFLVSITLISILFFFQYNFKSNKQLIQKLQTYLIWWVVILLVFVIIIYFFNKEVNWV